MTASFKVAVLYATNFADVSPGGIQSIVRSLARSVPSDVELTHVGMGAISAEHDGTFVDIGDPSRHRWLPLNLRFMWRLLRIRRWLRGFDRIVIHRVEHAVVLPRGVDLTVVLHGASWNAWRTGRRGFGIAYVIAEFIAVARSTRTFSVAWPDHTRAMRRFGARAAALRPPVRSAFSAPVDRREAGSEALTRILYVGRLAPEKRPDLAVDVAAALGVGLEVFGDGVERDRVRASASAMGVPLTLHGHVDEDSLAERFRAARHDSVLVCTSRFEGYSLAVVEAAACGVPVVGIDAPGVSRAVEACGGIVVRDIDALPAAVEAAHRSGNRVAPSAVVATHDEQSLARTFWAEVTDQRGAGRADGRSGAAARRIGDAGAGRGVR